MAGPAVPDGRTARGARSDHAPLPAAHEPVQGAQRPAAVRSAALASYVRWAMPIRTWQLRRGFRLRVSAQCDVMREAVHLLRPADRDRDPAGPVPGCLLVGHID